MNEIKEETSNKVKAIVECIVDYSTPIFIVGKFNNYSLFSENIISATSSKEQLLIINNKYPKWLELVKNCSNNTNNILVITDFDKISLEEQKLFVDIISRNMISSENLPQNLKIMIFAENECQILPDIYEVIQYFEL